MASGCEKDGSSFSWCLGSKVKTADCMKTTYGACSDGKQTKICSSGIKDGKHEDCPNTEMTVSCRDPERQDKGWDPLGGEYWEGIWLRKKRHKIYTCKQGRMDEKAVHCSQDNTPQESEVCTKYGFWWEAKCR